MSRRINDFLFSLPDKMKLWELRSSACPMRQAESAGIYKVVVCKG